MMQIVVDILLILIYSFLFVLLLAWCYRFYRMYANQVHVNGIKWIMLEIKLPRVINKSPVAMEYVIASLLQGGGVGTWLDVKIKGAVPMYASLEIASLEGTIHFYIRAQKKFKPLIEANLYAQYPGVEVVEAEDYTRNFRYEHLKKDTQFWGASYILAQTFKTGDKDPKKKDDEGKPEDYKMPADFLPIKTYVDLGLEKDPKEEFKNDQITPLLEFLGALKKGEYAAFQLLIQDSGKFDGKGFFGATYFNKVTGKEQTLGDLAAIRKAALRGVKKIEKGKKVFDEYGYPVMMKIPDGEDKEGKPKFKDVQKEYQEETTTKATLDTQLTMEDKGTIEAIEKKLSKPLVRCVMRMIYVAPSTTFKFDYIQNILSWPKAYAGANSLRLKSAPGYDYPWQDTMKKRLPWRKEEVFDAFVEREGFMKHLPDVGKDDWKGDVFFFPYKAYIRRFWVTLWHGLSHPFAHERADEVFTLNTEEIASLFHLPGETASVPSLPRIDSVKGVAPVNLPR